MGRKPDKPSLGLFGRLGIIPILIAVLGKAFFSTVSGLFVSKKHKPPTYYKWIVYNVFRTFVSNTSVAQEQFLSPNTDQLYLQFCKEQKIEPRTDDLGDGTKLHWLGQIGSSSTLLYFHGGGYNGSLAPPHVAFLKDHLDYITGHSSQHAAQTRSYAIAILAYDVAPYARYPRQLAQAAMALNHLLTILPASNILIGGDSAGAHLSLDVLAHILHPHPDRSVPEIKPLEGQKLKAAVLISPWVELSTHADSFRRNSWKEAVPTQAPVRWAKEFMGGCPRDPYNAPLTAPQGWWKGLSGILEDLYICGGRDEILIDDIDKFVEIMRAEWEGPGKLKVDMVDGEAHDSLVLDRVFGYAGKDIKMDKVVRDWQEEAVPL